MYLMMMNAIGSATKRGLVEYFGDSRRLYEASEEELMQSGLLKPEACHTFLTERARYQTEQTERYLQKQGYFFTTIEDEDYPEKLRTIHDPPYGLFYRGRMPDPSKFCVGIVGARMCSKYGSSIAAQIAAQLAKNEVEVISGMAYGIDAAATKGAIDAGGTAFGVMGCGVDICYPRRNLSLYLEVIEHGGILSEFPPKVAGEAFHFPMRNRIISGLSDVIVVVEAKKKSGSLITADHALDQGKDVYVVPGRITDALSEGTNRLIRQGAGIILNPEDFMEELCLTPHYVRKKSEKLKMPLEKDEMMVYSCVDLFVKTSQQIMHETMMDYVKLSRILVNLQLKGYIVEEAPDAFVRTNPDDGSAF
jgi:DNA processing protein